MTLAGPSDSLTRKPSGTFAALRYRNFRLMWISLLVSNSGTWLQNVAQDYLVYQLTGRALDLGLVNVVRAVALISLSFFGGTIADRLDRRKLLITTQLLFAASAALLGLLVQFGLVQVWHVVALSFFTAVLLALDQPARQSLIPDLLPREHLMNGVALMSVTFTGAAAFGPALAGPTVALLGIAGGFYLNAFSFFVVIGAVWLLRLPPRPDRRQHEPVGTALTEGLRYIAHSPAILLLVSLLTVFSLFAVPYQSLLPVFNDKVFHGGVTELGWLRVAPGVGALMGGFLLAKFGDALPKDWLVISSGVGFALLLCLFTLTPWLGGALLLLFLGNVLYTVFQSAIQTLMQQETSDAMRGRVMSLFAVSVIGMWPLGAGPMAWVSDHIGPARAVAGGSLVAGLYALTVAFTAQRILVRLRR